MPAPTAPAVDDPDPGHADPLRVILPAVLVVACLGPGELFTLDPVILASLALITIPQMLPHLNRRVHPCHYGLTTKTTQTIYDLDKP